MRFDQWSHIRMLRPSVNWQTSSCPPVIWSLRTDGNTMSELALLELCHVLSLLSTREISSSTCKCNLVCNGCHSLVKLVHDSNQDAPCRPSCRGSEPMDQWAHSTRGSPWSRQLGLYCISHLVWQYLGIMEDIWATLFGLLQLWNTSQWATDNWWICG